jgi:hypothetical protein
LLKKLAFSLIICSLLAACGQDSSESGQIESSAKKEQKSEQSTQKVTNTSSNDKAAEEVKVSPPPAEAQGEAVPLSWGEFFDNGDQTKPSEKFQSLSGKKIEFEGYMGEIISMNDGWFLLIEKPGAECPFCSNDQTFWNKIMIIFVKNPEHLRYIPGKVKITGTFDVGPKKDESGYVTMFRVYHATFESAK